MPTNQDPAEQSIPASVSRHEVFAAFIEGAAAHLVELKSWREFGQDVSNWLTEMGLHQSFGEYQQARIGERQGVLAQAAKERVTRVTRAVRRRQK